MKKALSPNADQSAEKEPTQQQSPNKGDHVYNNMVSRQTQGVINDENV